MVLPFNEFLSNIAQVVSKELYYAQEFGDHFITQTEYTIDVDDVFGFEDFACSIKRIASRLGLSAPALPPNKRGPYGDYTQYYSADARDTIANIYRDEIRAFGYQFGK